MSKCTNIRPIQGCFTTFDGLTKVPIIIHIIYDQEQIAVGQAYTLVNDNQNPIDIESYLGGGTVEVGSCEISKNYEIMVVRLDGSLTNDATAKPEGIGALITDVGNTFTLPALGYYGYDLAWLGDTNRGAILEWNGISYRAGLGGGTAGYSFSELPVREFTGELGTHSIVLTAQVGAYLELRFKKPI